MQNFFNRFSSQTIALLTLGLAVGAVAPLVHLTSNAVVAAPNSEASFPDIENHWARPFIETLAEQNILAGYLDGTFRPNKPVQRDEFAAVIRQAFNENPVRPISSGSVYKDVPADYWAVPAITEAYQSGMMTGYPGGFFRPNQNISRVEALVALQKRLNSPATTPVATATPTTTVDPTPSQPVNTTQATNRGGFLALPMMALMQPVVKPQANTNRRATKPRVYLPLPMMALMQPVVRQQATPQTPPVVASNPDQYKSDSPSSVASEPNSGLTQPASFVVSDYYEDAEKIPHYAVGSVAEATKANIVVNHPNQNILNPTQPATRGDIAAFLHQTLAAQGKIEPLSSQVEASNYIVNNQ